MTPQHRRAQEFAHLVTQAHDKRQALAAYLTGLRKRGARAGARLFLAQARTGTIIPPKPSVRYFRRQALICCNAARGVGGLKQDDRYVVCRTDFLTYYCLARQIKLGAPR